MPATSAPASLKDWFDPPRYRSIADNLRALEPAFDHRGFLDLTLASLETRSLMERLSQTAVAAQAALPGPYLRQLAVLRALAPTLDHGFVAIFLSDFVARFGLEHRTASLETLRYFTRFGSAEFAIRAFIEQDPPATLATLLQWAREGDEHERRLASEGCRPRLPWGRRLGALVRDPAPLLPILETLRDDPSLYVRKSVANNLNDIAKDHPDWMLDRLASWDLASPRTAWIARRAARTLLKRGHPRALRLFGLGAAPRLARAALRAAPARLYLGGTLELQATLHSSSKRPQRLLVDYIVHYVRYGGRTSPKVFRWTEITLAAREHTQLTHQQIVRDFTTRRHHPGLHRVELQINGRILARTRFTLLP